MALARCCGSVCLRKRVCVDAFNRHTASLVAASEPLSENDRVSRQFVNRNPRNLEQMLLAAKPLGYALDNPPRNYWHKLLVERTQKHITASVVHNTGKIVLTASTTEWGIQKQLFSNIDRSAAANVARVLARRCLESGILFLHTFFDSGELASIRLQTFLEEMKKEGITLNELDPILPRRINDP
ncbi:large ribosomal subunit protein uL18m-like [Ornithodoros turicata]|uniref:large ribosomal subunit protein uL18m-like n=1 Tax=Ornithodoros turicata TaxID=34597 RepID=UPI003138EB40